ncbi:prepilin-type N-terminal cleavage/methylation domain-containing protein, partial [Candidatus Gracilibacteria bacterium]|nr:prepilin-type N-terminal cleavage/methylation domain-containing protein [Candidatus Gracilibacteria bacterium]
MHNQKNLIISISLNKLGFTIIELIVVITILAILGTIGFVSFSSYLVGVRDTSRQE